MKSGLLWYNANADEKLMDVIDEAAKRYREKFGVSPDTCYVNTAQLKEFAIAHRDALPRTLNLAVLPKNTIIKNHVWLGISNPMPHAEVTEHDRAALVAHLDDAGE